jgi:catechol 2,3-dioxygenase-like lactoylglutathione lyase family enzyme
MGVQRMEHIGVVVEDLAAATAFFVALGLEVEGETSVEGRLVDAINGLEGVRSDIVILRVPGDGSTKLELARYRSPSYAGDREPAPANAPGIRHLRGQLLAVLRARPGGDHRRARAEDRLTRDRARAV